MRKLLISIMCISIGISSIFCAFLFILIRILYGLGKDVRTYTLYQKIIEKISSYPFFASIIPVFFMGVVFGIVIIIVYIWIYIEKLNSKD